MGGSSGRPLARQRRLRTFEGDLVAGLHAAAVEGVGTEEHVVARTEGLTGEHRRRHVPPQPFEPDRCRSRPARPSRCGRGLTGAQERGPGHPGVAGQSLCDGRSLVAVERQAHLEVPAGAVSRRRGRAGPTCWRRRRALRSPAPRRPSPRPSWGRRGVGPGPGWDRARAGSGRGHGRHAYGGHGPGDRPTRPAASPEGRHDSSATRRRPRPPRPPPPSRRSRAPSRARRSGRSDRGLARRASAEGEHQRSDRS